MGSSMWTGIGGMVVLWMKEVALLAAVSRASKAGFVCSDLDRYNQVIVARW
jgi:hypothetical protein